MQSCHYRPQAKYTHCAQSALRGCLLLMARGALEGPFYVTTIFALPPTLVVDLQRVRCHSQTTHTHTQAHTTSICPSIRVSIQQKHRPIRPMCHCAFPPSHLPDNVCVSRTTARATVRPANHLTALPSMHMQNTARCTQFTRTHGVAHPSGFYVTLPCCCCFWWYRYNGEDAIHKLYCVFDHYQESQYIGQVCCCFLSVVVGCWLLVSLSGCVLVCPAIVAT